MVFPPPELPSLGKSFINIQNLNQGFPDGAVVKNLPVNAETQEKRVPSLGQGDSLEKELATLSSILAWEIPWTEEPGGLQSVRLQRVGHN